MNSTEHLSQHTLELLVGNELSQSERASAGLHLSYCPICRSRKDEVTLKLATERMWATYPASRDEAHIDDATFKRFWRGDLKDEAVLNAISHHCIACAQCRQRRQIVHANLETEKERSILLTLILAGVSRAWQRPKIIGGFVLALGLLTALMLFWPSRKPDHQGSNQPPAAAPDKQTTGNDEEKTASAVDPRPEEKKSSPRRSRRQPKPRQDLMAHVQTIDLTRVTDGDDSRSSDVPATTRPNYTVVVSNTSPTPVRIALPLNSKKGVYHASIRKRAFLDEVASVKGVSRNGKTLNLSLDFRQIENGMYVLRLEREAPRTGHLEYAGDYEFAVKRGAAKKRQPLQPKPPRD